MNYKVVIPIITAAAIVASITALYIIDIEQRLEYEQSRYIPEKLVFVDGQISEFFEGTNDIKKFSSQQDVQKFIMALATSNGGDINKWSAAYQDFAFEESLEMRATSGAVVLDRDTSFLATEPAMPTSQSVSDQSGLDYSETNVQVKGVDEPDFIKTDGKYVYIVSDNRLTIVESYPAENAKIVFKTAFDIDHQNLQNMFLNDNRLVVFYYGSNEEEVILKFDFEPRIRYTQTTHAQIIDISDRENPEIIKNYEVDGHFHNARMIGDFVYLVTVSGIDYSYPVIPMVTDDVGFTNIPDVYYFDSFDRNYNFNTITAVNVFEDVINSETYLMGGTGTIYVSEDSLYITYRQDLPYGYIESMKQERFFDVIVPLLPQDVQTEIRQIQNDVSVNSQEKWIAVSEILQDTYNMIDKNNRQKLFAAINEKLYEYDNKVQEESRKTFIHKIILDEENLEYKSKGWVPGSLLNQFSMDEYDGKFRVATTNEYYTPSTGNVRYNSVYVLDEGLNTVGSLEKIAPNESIFSARFIADRLYLVTFERIDPFFVIDLSQDTPKVLGELKIPGFSNYLHPYDENHVIGIGRDTIDKNGRVSMLGVKIALFDVTDVNKPSVLDEVIIGNQRTDSMALNDHRAFLFDKERNILSIPINSDPEALETNGFADIARYHQWHGYYVYELDTTNGFELKGTIQHDVGDIWPYSYTSPRSFYIEDVLYTVSDQYLKMNYIEDLEKINSIKLDERTGGFIEPLN